MRNYLLKTLFSGKINHWSSYFATILKRIKFIFGANFRTFNQHRCVTHLYGSNSIQLFIKLMAND